MAPALPSAAAASRSTAEPSPVNTTTLPSTARSSEAVPSTRRANCRVWSETLVSVRPGIDTSLGIASAADGAQ